MSETDIRKALASARTRFEIAGIPNPARDASALFVGLIEDHVGAADTMPPDLAQLYESAVARRIRRQPVSHIVGKRAFWMHDFIVTPDVLDPRPETEALIRAATDIPADALADPTRWPRLPEADWTPIPYERVLDLGTGSGCILASLLYEQPSATGLGVDISPAALDVAARNAAVAGVEGRATFAQSDWLAEVQGQFDLIVSNPPYIAAAEMADLAPEVLEWEPHLALTPGGDGLDAYRIIARDAPANLAPGGRLMVEIGPTQATSVRALFQGAGLTHLATIPDLDGRDRVISGEKPRVAAESDLSMRSGAPIT